MPPKQQVKQNLSGHVCFDVQQTMFFQEVNSKAHKLDMKRQHGMIEQKRGRNPLNAEKTPRDNEPFEYQPPPAAKQEERWHYPETDWGLMAKFRSQKQIYDDIYAKEKEYQSQVDRVQKIREQNQRMIQDEFDRQKAVYDHAKKQKEISDQARFDSIMTLDAGGHSGHSSRHSKSHGPDELDLALQKDAQAAAQAEEERRRKRKGHNMLLTLTHTDTPPKDFYHAKISTFKSVGNTHPEVLAEWRAKRAADYVNKHADSLEPPAARGAQETSFRPGGILPPKPKNFTFSSSNNPKPSPKPANTLTPVDLQKLDINVLTAELAKTEEQVARQLLKIKLNAKPTKSYEIPRNERRKSKKMEDDSPY